MNDRDRQEHAHPPGDFGYYFHHRPPRHSTRNRLILAIWLNAGMMVAEVIGGIWTNSLALLSDAGHMLTHIFALVVSFVALQLAARGLTTDKTYGYYRAEPIAALINGITIVLIVAVIVVEAVKKIFVPSPVHAQEMFVIAVAGLIVNMAGAFILKESAKDDINIKGAFVHLLTDLISSIAIVVGGAVIIWTGWELIDPILSLVISGVVLVWGVGLLKESTHVLMEGVPPTVDVEDLTRRVGFLEGVLAVHDVHIWQVSSGLVAMTCHILVDDVRISETEPIRDSINQLVSEAYGVGHTNLQFESTLS